MPLVGRRWNFIEVNISPEIFCFIFSLSAETYRLSLITNSKGVQSWIFFIYLFIFISENAATQFWFNCLTTPSHLICSCIISHWKVNILFHNLLNLLIQIAIILEFKPESFLFFSSYLCFQFHLTNVLPLSGFSFTSFNASEFHRFPFK